MSAKLCAAWLLFWFALSSWAGLGAGDHFLPNSLIPPTLDQPFGYDAFGRHLLGIVLKASALSGAFALIAVIASCAIGLALGSGLAMTNSRLQYYGLRSLEIFLAFPSILIALAWAAVRGPGWDTLLVALGVGTLPMFARLIYVRSRELLSEEYVTAARSLGADKFRIIARHLFPSLLSLCAVKAPNLFATALLSEATLTFLGVGAPIGKDTWGSLLAQGRDYLLEAPHIAIVAGFPLMLTVLALQLLSEKLGQSR